MSNQPFFLSNDSLSFGPGSELYLAGRSASSLTEEYGSPLIVMLEDVIRANCRAYTEGFKSYPSVRIYFASKAFLTVGFCRLLMSEGLGVDVVSEGELYTALQAGMDPQNIVMHGNAKTDQELIAAVKSGVGRVVLDNLADIPRLGTIARQLGVVQKVHIRVTPGVKPSTHQYIQTGQQDSKFGFNLEGGEAEGAVIRALTEQGLKLVGIHCHIGSQIFEMGAFDATATLMLEFYAGLQRRLGAELGELNLGGGVGIRYQPEDDAPSIADHTARMSAFVLSECARLGIEPPVLCEEPGRSIVGEAGVTLYTVQSVKRIPGIRNYAGLDGGMTDNPRYALYGARHYAMRASNAPEARGERGTEMWSLSGKCCETGDMLIKDTLLPSMSPGDIVAMFSTGAYTYSMASNYNRVQRPPVVLAGRNGTGLLARREQNEDLIRLDETPAWLR